MSQNIREILRELVAARNDRSPQRAARVLSDDVRYWDCERGNVEGRDAVAAALTATDARIEFETVAAGDDHAVVELRVDEGGTTYRSTEVYGLAGGGVESVKAYFDPAARS